MRTGPGMEESAGAITPSRLKTIPFFMTKTTVRSASTSLSGFARHGDQVGEQPG